MRSRRLFRPLLVSGGLAAGLCWLVLGLSPTTASSTSANNYRSTFSTEHVVIGKTKCTDCHDDKTNKKNIHPPTADGCDACHEYKEKGDTAEVKFTMEVGELCGTCHTDEQGDVTTKKFAHAPVKEIGCPLCHTPHSSDYPFLLRADPKDVCFACHKLNVKQQRTSTGLLILFPETTVAADYPDKARKIILDANEKGHPFIGHPVFGTINFPKKGTAMSCTTCHNPHAGNTRQMYQKDLKGQALCDKCHN